MSVNSVEHELMLTAQNDKEISNLVGKKAQITGSQILSTTKAQQLPVMELFLISACYF